MVEMRHILLLGCLLIGSCAFAESSTPHEYRLRFFHTHTGERLDIVYRIGNEYIPESLGRAGVELNVICGYRTPWSNQFLRTHSSGVAEHSLHMEAEAIDIRLPGVKTSIFRDAALQLLAGA